MRTNKAVVPDTLARRPTINSMGLMLYDPIWAQKWHPSNHCEMMHIVQGEIHLWLGDERIVAGAGKTLVIPSLASHRDEFDPAAGLKLFMIFFSWPGEKKFFELVKTADMAAFDDTLNRTLARQFDYFLSGIHLDSSCGRLAARTQLHTILLTMLAGVQARAACAEDEATGYGRRHRHDLMLQAKQYLSANYRTPVTLDQIARALRVSPYYLSHVFSQEAHFSLFEYLTSLRMNHARELLRQQKMNVSEVAFAVGYDDSHYFSKVFHRFFKRTPRSLLARRDS